MNKKNMRTAAERLLPALLLPMILLACQKQEGTLDRQTSKERSPTGVPPGVYRSLQSRTAFRILPEQKADYYDAAEGETLAATYTVIGERLRIEVASPMFRTVENYLIRPGFLEHEESGKRYYAEEAFLREYLGMHFGNYSAISVPDPKKTFYISSDENRFDPENRTYNRSYLTHLQSLATSRILIFNIMSVGRDRSRKNVEEFRCFLLAGTEDLPRAENIRGGLIGFKLGEYRVLEIQSITPASGKQGVVVVKGTYSFAPNALGARLLEVHKKPLQKQYRFRAKVGKPRSIADQPTFHGFDWGYPDKTTWETQFVEEADAPAPTLQKGPNQEQRSAVEEKVNKVKSDLRSVATALGYYWVDNNGFPTTKEGLAALRPLYIMEIPADPWGNPYRYARIGIWAGAKDEETWGPWDAFVPESRARGRYYAVWSPGPDGDHDFPGPTSAGTSRPRATSKAAGLACFYDPTNGVFSNGDIVLLGGTEIGELGWH